MTVKSLHPCGTSSEEEDTWRISQFRSTCTRWASNCASPSDIAAVSAVSANCPLPPPHDPAPHGLTPEGLVPEHLLHAFLAAKDEARAAVHASATSSTAAALTAALARQPYQAPPPPYTSVPCALSKIPATPSASGLACAANFGIGQRTCVSWIVPRAQLEALGSVGAGLAEALVSDGWRLNFDAEDPSLLIAVADPRCRDHDLQAIVLAEAAAARKSGVGAGDGPIAAGRHVLTEELRGTGTGAGALKRFWWRLQLAFAGTCRIPVDFCLGRKRCPDADRSAMEPLTKKPRLGH